MTTWTRKTRIVTTKSRWTRNTVACLAIAVLSMIAQPLAAAGEKEQKKEKPYALIFGTAYGPDDRPLYGVRIIIHPQGKKNPRWEQMSDHRGEFAQRVPPGPADYLVTGDAEYAPIGTDGKPQLSKKKRLKGETKVHLDGDERQDISVHLTD